MRTLMYLFQIADPGGDTPIEAPSMESPAIVFDWPWLGLVAAFFLPLVISAIKQRHWEAGAKKALALIVCSVAAIISVMVDLGYQNLSLGDALKVTAANIVGVYTIASVSYQNLFKGSAIDVNLTNIGSNDADLHRE